MNDYHAIAWVDGRLRLLDQRELPHHIIYLDYTTAPAVAVAIRNMVVRGAPAIGIAAAYGMVLAAFGCEAENADAVRSALSEAAAVLRAARPTAVNLFGALERVLARAADPALKTALAVREAVLEEAHAIYEQERQANLAIGRHALRLIPEGARILHHCNTGPLATGEYGTALRVIIAAHEAGKRVHAFVDETRPLLQGARLTAWELQQLGVPYTLIVDGAAAHIMRTHGVDLCVVGCDRIAANGDTANKIGTYHLALAAHAHGIPFYVVGPTSTVDLSTPTGDHITIEERPAEEITSVGACRIAPHGATVMNPAFDVTPARYITAIITERGIAYPPFTLSLAQLLV